MNLFFWKGIWRKALLNETAPVFIAPANNKWYEVEIEYVWFLQINIIKIFILQELIKLLIQRNIIHRQNAMY